MNAYALICGSTRQSVLIDPGADPHTLKALLEGSSPVAILITHDHPDHTGALDEMRRHLKVPIMAHTHSRINADRRLEAGEKIAVGEHALRVYATPGHTDDQVSFGVEGSTIHIVGDTIFEGGPGKTWSSQDFQTTLTTLRNVILAWPDDAVCHPGHGASFRLGDVRAAIENFLEKDHGDFFGDATWDM
jgi:glyoxylase-like metal-dependent hydrolase (beta-lactamase superfamily II)